MSTITPDTDSLTWNIDASHSSIDFSVKHMGIFTVRGSLGAITGIGETVAGELKTVSFSIDLSGITTSNEQRDGHLKSADFLNIAEFPTAEFASTSITKTSDGEYTVTGDFTLHGVTKSVTVEIEAVAPVKDPWGNTRTGATGSGKILRSDFGLTYNSVLESGHALISDEVKFTFDLQAVSA
jgi:polyisoprenoid-binding protein YceI